MEGGVMNSLSIKRNRMERRTGTEVELEGVSEGKKSKEETKTKEMEEVQEK